MKSGNHCIRVVSSQTGLSPHVIRVWEKRYGAVMPGRTGTNRRLYTDREVERLSLLRLATAAGHSISGIARLPDDRLRALVAQTAPLAQVAAPRPAATERSLRFIESALTATSNLDAPALEASLNRALVAYGQQGLLRNVVAPLAQRIGDLWRAGSLTAAHEHFLSAALRTMLGTMMKRLSGQADGPRLVVATPAGQVHELGAAIAGAEAANVGWRVIYLGANLPAAEIAGAAVEHTAAAIALSLVYPEDDPRLADELRDLRRLLPDSTKIIVGGRSTGAYRDALHQIGATVATDLDELSLLLDAVRSRSA